MKKTLFLMAMVAMTFSACNNGKSEAEIRKEIQAEMQHKQDSVRLAEAEQRASEAEAKAEEAAKKADAAAAKAEKAKRAADNAGASSYDYGYTPTEDFSWLSEHRLTSSDIAGCSKQELRILRNAIYARHGYIFKSADLRDFFNQFYWYTPRYSNVDKQLSSLERSNIAFIKSFE